MPSVAMLLASLAIARSADISLATAPPVVVKTVPVAGATNVSTNLTEILVTYSKPMMDGSWSWVRLGQDTFPETAGEPRYRDDGRTCVFPVRLQPGKFYAIWLNTDRYRNFKDRDGRTALPYLLTFTTAATNAPSSGSPALTPIPNAATLPGKLVFHGRYQHRSRGIDLETPGELWVKQTPDGSLNVLASLPSAQMLELISGDPQHRIIRHHIQRLPSGDYSGYHVRLDFGDHAPRLTRRGVRQDLHGRELEVPPGAVFDPNSRPDNYGAANLLLRSFALASGEVKDFKAYDWDNDGEAFADYSVRIRHAGKETVTVPAGTFEANHLVLTQTSSANTWFKKRAGHVTDFWVLDNHTIVRVLRHREPYEIVLLDSTIPEKSEGTNTAPRGAESEPQKKPIL